MTPLPDRASLEHLKKQAKDLLRRYREGDADAIARFANALPTASGRSAEEIAQLGLRLHDAQSCVAREYGFASWTELASFVEARAALGDQAARVRALLGLIYPADVAGDLAPAKPHVAARLLDGEPDLAGLDPYVACACGNEAALSATTAADPAWVNRPGGPLNLPPLVAVTHSSLRQIPAFRDRLYRCGRHLLQAGADPNQSIGNRYPPGSLAKPDDSNPLSALYGAAGINHDPALAALLLDAGADPNDGESLYHSLENLDCTRLLLECGARIAGSNAMYRALDLEDAGAIELLLAHGGNANEPADRPPLNEWGSPLLWAIRRRRSLRHVEALLAAGADPRATTPRGISAYRMASQFGLADVAERLALAGAAETLTDDEEFVAACARADAEAARRIKAVRPDLPGSLPEEKLRLLPDMVAEGGGDAVRLMVTLGWPIAVRGGDWSASALNLAVFLGDAGLTSFLLEHGASWREEQGFGDNVAGTLAWASLNRPAEDADWIGCARALLAHGMPHAVRESPGSDIVLIDGRRLRFSEDVTDILVGP